MMHGQTKIKFILYYFTYIDDARSNTNQIKENIKTSAKQSVGRYELKQHVPWFDEECWRFCDQRK